MSIYIAKDNDILILNLLPDVAIIATKSSSLYSGLNPMFILD